MLKYSASSGRIVGDTNIFNEDFDKKSVEGYDEKSDNLWEIMYKSIMDNKYAKGSRNFSNKLTGIKQTEGIANIYLIPRIRAGPSYLNMPLQGIDNKNVQYCPISKGFPMQDVSSFSLGPIKGEGLCLVNAAFSKSITIAHIEGNGVVELKRKNFWKRSKKPEREIIMKSETKMLVNGKEHNITEWLINNENLWYPQWELWRRCIALCSMGDFHWTDNLGETLIYRKGNEYLNFVQWKKMCYIKPSYELLPKTSVFQFLLKIWKENNIPLGLVHPKNHDSETIEPITPEYIHALYNSNEEMCCQPYVVAGLLLGVHI